MKPFLLLWALLAFVRVHATDPATSASNVQFTASAIDGGQFTMTFNAGSGNGRIVVVKAGSDITGTPVDGVTYTAGTNSSNAPFAAAGTGFTAAGEWVVYRNASPANSTNINVTVTGLTPGTTYYVAIFEYNTGGTPSPDYSVVTPTNKFVTTKTAPTVGATLTSISNATGNTLRVNFQYGNGSGRIVVARKGSSVSALPVDTKAYTGNSSFGTQNGTSYILDAETFVVFKSTGGTQGTSQFADISNLEPNTQYSFAVFEFNGSNSPAYLVSGSQLSATTNAGPSQASTGVNFGTIDGNAISISWTRGNGSRTIVVVKQGSAVSNVPANGALYTANTAFGTPAAEWVNNSGEYVVSAGTGTSATVTNLSPATTYYFAVFSYDQDNSNNTYYLATTTNKSQSTVTAPLSARTLSASNITGTSAQLTYGNVNGNNGGYRILAIRENAPITWTPTNGTQYNSSTNVYGQGLQVTPGTYLLYGQSNGGAPNVTGLSAGHTYYVACWDMNGTNSPQYLIPGGTVSFTLANEPTNGATGGTFPTIDGNRLRFDWSVGNGGRRIVIIRKGSAVTTLPADGWDPSASTSFGSGDEMGNGLGEYVVYNGSSNSVTVTNLDPSSTYHFAVVEYNATGSGPDYLLTAGKILYTSQATVSAPATQTSNLAATGITATSATITFGPGNGSSRIFVMRAGSPVTGEPTDLQSYNASGTFGGGNTVGSGNYVVNNGAGASFSVGGMQAGTTYYVAAFEYNGNAGPVYKTPAATFSFTTTGGATAPTTGASAPIVESVEGDRFTLRWTGGNGTSRMVIARKDAAVDFVPADGSTYTANAAFAAGTDLGDGQYVVYNGSASTVSLTGLTKSSTYHFAVVEYNGSGAGTLYATALTLATTGSTATVPASESSAPNTTPSSNSILLSWQSGSGTGRLVLARAGSAPESSPADLTKYTANNRFGDGPQLAAGEFVVYSGTGNSVNVIGLDPATTYYFKVIEYNGTEQPVYNPADFLALSAATSGGTLPVTWLYLRGRESAGNVHLEWATASEQNNQYFIVERSTGGAFTEAGRVAGAGNSATTRTYRFTDANTPQGRLQYRVRQVDADGRSRYSPVISVRGAQALEVRVLNNPASGSIAVQSTLSASFVLADAGGRIVKRGMLQPGLQRIDTNGMSSGLYFLKLITTEQKQTISVVIQ